MTPESVHRPGTPEERARVARLRCVGDASHDERPMICDSCAAAAIRAAQIEELEWTLDQATSLPVPDIRARLAALRAAEGEEKK
jgi:hypothetical protein